MPNQPSTFDAICATIADAAKTVKGRDPAITGYRFLYSARETFTKNNGLMLAGLNPGNEADLSDRNYASDGRNAYRTEAWTGKRFQPEMVRFMTELFGELDVTQQDLEKCFDQTLTSNWIPFRAGRFSKLCPETQAELRRFATQLWTWALPETGVRAIICCGQECYDGFAAVRRSDDRFSDLTLAQITHASSASWDLESNLRRAIGILENAAFTLSVH